MSDFDGKYDLISIVLTLRSEDFPDESLDPNLISGSVKWACSGMLITLLTVLNCILSN